MKTQQTDTYAVERFNRNKKSACPPAPAQAQHSPDESAEIMKASALQDAKVKRWEGWDWKGYQTSIIRQNYKLRDAQRLADALKMAVHMERDLLNLPAISEALAEWSKSV